MTSGRAVAIGTVVFVLTVIVGGIVAVDVYLRRTSSEPEILQPQPTATANATAQPMLDPPPTPTLVVIPITLPPTTVTAPPTPTKARIPDAAVEPEPEVYKVTARDTLLGIADRFGVTMEELIELNQIENPSLISVGQELLIPPE